MATRLKRLLVALLGGCGALLLIVQLGLPALAEQEIRGGLPGASAVRVEVVANPALKLLWGSADVVRVRARSLEGDVQQLSDQLARARGVDDLDVRIARVSLGRLDLRDLGLLKHHGLLVGNATLESRDLADALPSGVELRGLTPQGTLVLGLRARADQRYIVRVLGGRVVVRPDGPLGSLFAQTVFADRHIEVRSVTFTRRDRGYLVRASAALR